MLKAILGWFFLLSGIIFFLRPMILKKSLEKKIFKKIKKYLIIVLFLLGAMIIKISWGIKGAGPKVLLIIGVVSIIKGFFFLKSKGKLKTVEWLSTKPIKFFRLISLLYIGLGLFILYF